jgi:hypothetical protein
MSVIDGPQQVSSDDPVPQGSNPEPASNAHSKLDRPSEYLRARCPLCFGAKQWYNPNEKYDISMISYKDVY